MKMKILALVCALLMWAGSVFAQSSPLPMQCSNAFESTGGHVFTGNVLNSLTVTWNAEAAAWLMIFDGTAVPSNGSTTSCSVTQQSGCLLYCAYVTTTDSQTNGSQSYGSDPFPISARKGVTAVLSTSACGTLTAEANHAWFCGQAR